MSAPKDVVVIGAGIIGVTTAYCLARHGVAVTVIDRQPGPGLETSFANGGLVTPSMSDPWAAPGMPWKLVKWLGREDSPFLLRPAAMPGLMGWGLRFLLNCGEAAWRRNTATILSLAEYSSRVLAALSAETGLAYDRATAGTLRLFRDKYSMEAARRSAEVVGDLGVRHRALDAEACAALEPALAPRRHLISGGIHFPDDASGDAYLFTTALARRCAELGVTFRYGVSVRSLQADRDKITGLRTDDGEVAGAHYVLAGGPESPRLVRGLGVKLPIYPVKGYAVTLSAQGWNAGPRVPLVDDGRKMAITALGDRIRLAGTAEFTSYDRSMNARRAAALLDGMLDLFPDFPNDDTAEPWTGLRPMTPDGIPILGPTPLGNLTLNTGHGHLGWTMACGSARVVADLVAGRQPELDFSGMTLERF